MKNHHVGAGFVAGTNSGLDQLADVLAAMKVRQS
jgi:hypothetical protein